MFYINFYSDKWVGTVLLTLTGQEDPGGKSRGERGGEAGAGVEIEIGGEDTRDIGGIPLPAVIQVCFILFDFLLIVSNIFFPDSSYDRRRRRRDRDKEKEKEKPEVERLAEIERKKTAGDRQKELEARQVEIEANRRIEQLVAKRVEEELEKRKDEIEKEVLRRVEEAKKIMEETMMKELELRKQEQLEEARKREVFITSFKYYTGA